MIDEDQVDDVGAKEEDPGAQGKHWRPAAETTSGPVNMATLLPRL